MLAIISLFSWTYPAALELLPLQPANQLGLTFIKFKQADAKLQSLRLMRSHLSNRTAGSWNQPSPANQATRPAIRTREWLQMQTVNNAHFGGN